jgi:hypothetical protein
MIEAILRISELILHEKSWRCLLKRKEKMPHIILRQTVNKSIILMNLLMLRTILKESDELTRSFLQNN